MKNSNTKKLNERISDTELAFALAVIVPKAKADVSVYAAIAYNGRRLYGDGLVFMTIGETVDVSYDSLKQVLSGARSSVRKKLVTMHQCLNHDNEFIMLIENKLEHDISASVVVMSQTLAGCYQQHTALVDEGMRKH